MPSRLAAFLFDQSFMVSLAIPGRSFRGLFRGQDPDLSVAVQLRHKLLDYLQIKLVSEYREITNNSQRMYVNCCGKEQSYLSITRYFNIGTGSVAFYTVLILQDLSFYLALENIAFYILKLVLQFFNFNADLQRRREEEFMAFKRCTLLLINPNYLEHGRG